ncbi:hypothetical protein [Methylicorpusculum sp.]|uniref:hypothetical protein n=1 Tax=Methylicorpusculum sp. TaxID=2713644 RepID=UPI002731D13A|nr:hypothetical protein [Methylicorpusculum sp.]MDP2177235.1 hypothetical protein [Methylicorpusculum sp.]MDP3531160.1 hypothetical protein [Methylicorpusculum sp.]MDZ4153663.1 hypothetical protein [Methylicorpusculum sp.]
MNQADQEWLENRVSAAVSDDFYLDREEEKRIKEEGSAKGIPVKDIELVIRMELDKYGAVSERLLLVELDRLLHQFTDNDKELDGKEERDTLDKVSKPALGKKMGLDHRIAEEYVSSFCKVNGVRRNSDLKKWGVPVAVVAVLALGLIGFYIAAKPNTETVTQTVIETRVVDTNAVVLTDKDRIEIDDQLRRAVQFVEKAQYTDPPEKSAKASLDQIKQIDPNGQYRGDEVKGLSSRIVDHYISLAEKSTASGDKASAGKWIDRAKLMNIDREVIMEKEKALGLSANGEQ